MVLKSYFDGGNKADSAQYDALSLAVVSGTKDEWKPFDLEWKKVLKRHKVSYLHTTEAVSRNGIYEGWSICQRDLFMKDCVDVAARHCARATVGTVPGKFGLFPFVISVVLRDFIEYAQINPKASPNAEQACLRQAISVVIEWSEEQAACEECHCIFDRGEPFYGHLVHLLESRKARKDATLLQKISFPIEAISARTPALQLADLYAWCQGHRNAPDQPKWHSKILKTHFRWLWIDGTNVQDIDRASQDVFLTWKLPKRKATK